MDHQLCTCPETLAIATIPMQKWCDPYSWETALYEGTIFPCMNFLFFKAPLSAKPTTASDKPDEKAALLNQIDTISFAVNDLTLYLDTHPDCPNGTTLFYELIKKRLDLLAEFSDKYYPLTQFSMGIEPYDTSNYNWPEAAMPWEGGDI